MFVESLLDSGASRGSHRGWATLVSFTTQALAISGLLLLPLIYTEGLPKLALISSSLAAPAPPPAPAPLMHGRSAPRSNLSSDDRIIAPPSIPPAIAQFSEITAPPPVDLAGVGVPGGMGRSSAINSVLGSIGNALDSVAPPAFTVAKKPRISVMMQGNLIQRVEPRYPPLAIQARIQGRVVLQAVISRTGTIENLQVLSGHPMLVRAAMDAVRQWRYRPYILNDEPVEVETQVTVNFVLAGG